MKKILLAPAALLLLSACALQNVQIKAPVADQSASSSSSFSSSPAANVVTFEKGPVRLVSPDGRWINVQAELAASPLQREWGLMGRTELPEGTGMLFVFDAEQTLTFWMKNTLIPLDIVYFDADSTFVSSATMTPCEADPCVLYPSFSPAQYALELAEGFVQREGVGEGWTLVME